MHSTPPRSMGLSCWACRLQRSTLWKSLLSMASASLLRALPRAHDIGRRSFSNWRPFGAGRWTSIGRSHVVHASEQRRCDPSLCDPAADKRRWTVRGGAERQQLFEWRDSQPPRAFNAIRLPGSGSQLGWLQFAEQRRCCCNSEYDLVRCLRSCLAIAQPMFLRKCRLLF